MAKLISYIWGNLLYLLSYIAPKSKNIWVFGAWGGSAYADNPKYMYEYVTSNHPDIEAVWLTRDEKIIKKLRQNKRKVLKLGSLAEIWCSIRAEVGITSNGMVDINRFACARIKVVETWHGIPMKPVLLADPKEKAKGKRQQLHNLSIFFPFLKKNISYNKHLAICGSADFTNQILRKVFGQQPTILNIGFPRLDGLFNPAHDLDISKFITQYKLQGKRVGIYMPTYRRQGEFDIIDYFISNLSFIERKLAEENCILFLKIHPFDVAKFPEHYISEYIHNVTDDSIGGDIYGILGLFDFLITDYSSILFDFSILSRPIFILCPDRSSYVQSNGEFVFDYENLNLPTSCSWENLLNKIQISLTDTQCRKLFEDVGNKVHHLKDGNNSKRLFEYISNSIRR